MSETKHTAELWEVDVEVDATLHNDGRTETLIEIMGDGRSNTPCYATSKADAHRIVAAVNAVKGIPNSALESGVIKEAIEALEFANGYIQPGAGLVNHRIANVLAKLRGI